jgi:GAF domain-containing protein
VFVLHRAVVKPFTEEQVKLVESFAAQAVIAIENARLLNELRQRTTELTEALEQQTGTSEVLQVISRSPGDLEPIFSAMLEKAVRICDASFGNVQRWDGDALQLVASHNTPPAFAEARQSPYRPDPALWFSRVLTTNEVVQINDAASEKAYLERRNPQFAAAVELGGVRTCLLVPLLMENEPMGVFSLYRQEVRPFTDKQIALVTNFAAQAVIAIENARLLDELHQRTTDLTEALEQQTATSDVLQVISSSPGELGPIFAAMLERSVRICDANFGNIYRWEDETAHLVAAYNTPPAFAEYRKRFPHHQPNPKLGIGRMFATKETLHITDARAAPAYIEQRDPSAVAAVELGGVRSYIAVPMLKEGELIGGFTLCRQEVRPFADKQIELVKNFAAQAVIAIENARLLNELRQRTDDLTEALEQQTATSDVLRVISSSPGDLGAVFNKMLDNAIRVCDAKFGTIDLQEGGGLRLVAACGVPPAFAASRGEGPFHPAPGGILDTVVKTARTVHIQDLAATQSYIERHPRMVEAVEVAGIRTAVGVPMRKDDELVGIIAIFRREVSPFTDKQIELLSNFADQAVIAIENARLLNELRQRTDDLSQRTTDLTEALEQQTATSEVLQVISSSPGDLEPVFTAMLDRATRICEAKFGNLFLREGETFRAVAWHGEPTYVNTWQGPALTIKTDMTDLPLARLAATRLRVHVADLRLEAAYKAGHEQLGALVDKGAREPFSSCRCSRRRR